MFKKIVPVVLAISLISAPALAAPSSWARDEVNAASSAGLIPESINDNFTQAITREEFCEAAMLLYNLLGGAPLKGENPFSDTDNPSVTSAAAAGIVNGVGEGLFVPEAPVTRQEICAMLQRCVKAAKPSSYVSDVYPGEFPDENDISNWAKKSVQYVNMLEVILGDENGRINPLSNTTREQAILLIYRLRLAVSDFSSSILAAYGFLKSGNTATNMLPGAFAVKTLDGKMYISDDNGISELLSNGTLSSITKEKATAIYADSNAIYYISASDSLIYYVLPGKTPASISSHKAQRFSISGDTLYYLDTDNKIYSVSIKGENEKLFTDGVCTMPIVAGNSLYYYTSDGINSINIASLEKECIYSGTVSDLVYENSTFFFKNSDGFLCMISGGDTTPIVLSTTPIDTYCVYDGAVVYTRSGALYKRDLRCRFEIKLGDYTGVALNSFGTNIYIKEADGKINSLNVKTLEKTSLN